MSQFNNMATEDTVIKFDFSTPEKEFLKFDESNFDLLLEKTELFHTYLNKNSLNPKFKTNKFSYIKELENVCIPETGKKTEDVFSEASEFFEGSMRTQSPYAVFNMVPSPLMDTVVGSTISQLYNTNSLMDSFGVDMHKNGLCPYATSMFVCKTKDNFDYLNDGNYEFSDNDFELGNFRAYRYTFENSRAATGIITSWIAMNRLGRTGFQDYLIKLNEFTEIFIPILNSKERLQVINNSLGWEIVFTISFKGLKDIYTETYEEIAKAFIQYYGIK